MKVKQFYNKNQFIIEGENEITFQSYDSTIATIKNSVLTLFTDWDHSHTTLKHLYLFLCDYRYCIDNDQVRQIIFDLQGSKNKRKDIQKAIDLGLINYKED